MNDSRLRKRKGARSKASFTGRHSHQLIFSAVVLVVCAIALAARMVFGPDADTLLIAATGLAILGISLHLTRYADLRNETFHSASNEFYKLLLNSAAPAILAINEKGNVFYVNEAAEHMLGYSAVELMGPWGEPELLSVEEGQRIVAEMEEICGHPPGEFTGALRRAQAYLNCVRTLPPSQLPAFIVHLRCKDGARIRAELRISAIRDEDGSARGLMATSTPLKPNPSPAETSGEVSDLKKSSAMVATVSHELRTPLTSIHGALGLLSSGMLGPLSEKATKLLLIALNNSERLLRIINDILDLERMQNGREPLDFRPMQLEDLVRQAIDGITPVADSVHVRLLSECPPVQLVADPDRLLQVLTNLLSNAVKFSPENGVVTIRAAAGPEEVQISVLDEGRGIPTDKLESIFDRFQQVESTDARQKGGSGLGLTICRTIVVQHGGRIWAERNAGHGSCLHLSLPLQPAP
ncbi:ATP-binding protein [Telmatobacter bradus]|uniref:PAS domain-containing sensor histidine kinase n=1 Tax=Telmatobacter bradus TaxID=474953 RepID=UPI003B43557F